MREPIQWTLNQIPAARTSCLSVMALDQVEKARAFHRSFPQYTVTPLTQLDKLAKRLGLGGVWLKDESYRFGLNAFKVLGGSFAMARYIAGELGRDVSEMTYDYLTSQDFQSAFGQATFFTATDGNHGRGVARGGEGPVWARRPSSICPKAPPRAALTISPERARRSPSKRSTMTTVCVWRRRKRPGQNTAL